MNNDIQELKAIHMSVQTADLNMIGFKCAENITLSCGLMNIGRGICSVSIKPCNSLTTGHSGSLNIEISRPFMKAIIELGQESFVKTRELLLRAAVRPITLLSAAIKAMQDVLVRLKNEEDTVPKLLPSFAELKTVVGFDQYFEEDAKYAV